MAESLEINQMLANAYEPKRMFRWILEIDGIDAFTATSAARPSKTIDKTVIDYINQKIYHAGKTEWQPISITLHDPIAPSAAQKVTTWLNLVHNSQIGRMGYASFYKKNFSLKMLDGPGNVVEKWNYVGAFPTSINYGELNYENSDTMKIQMEIQMDDCVLEF